MPAWRDAGLSYVNYSSICARLVRLALKPEFRADAMKRDITSIKITRWRDGKPIKKTEPNDAPKKRSSL
ncbi:hypothetical protein Zmor_015926 [Zophobas morio]|uniref:ATP synthase subunit epsilon, mitochondrial n=1 Tax=Zophobas morio TaxID=2755281 RepID=A0AA38IK99_9CUCU|nr:hypothetical protein Zmor_015926 [Zophobas morio]